jgi:GxxExxY protein
VIGMVPRPWEEQALPTTEGTENTEKDALSNAVIGCAIEVHQALGPGLPESAYEKALAYEFAQRKLVFEVQKPIAVQYKSIELDCAYRLDFVVDGSLIVELKAVAHIEPIHEAQLLTYMKLAEIRKGLLINFNVRRLKDGIKRMVL